MAGSLPIGKVVRIRDCGCNEVWLHERIAENPSVLGLGELEVMARERIQSSGGRLDILLKDPEDDSMYEVEVMLGDTDETHVIRTIEYWSREKRKWPQRQHYPVLIAEQITRRFFDVIQELSHAIPLIAIQATVVEAGGQRILSFHKILDTYEEQEDSEVDYEVHDEAFWVEKAAWTNEAAKALLNIVHPVFTTALLRYRKQYIAIEVNNQNYFLFFKRAAGKCLLSFWVGERLVDASRAALDGCEIQYRVVKNQTLRFTTEKRVIEEHPEVFQQLAERVKEAWSG